MHFLGMLWCRIVKNQETFLLRTLLSVLPKLYRVETSSNANMRRYCSVARLITRKVHSKLFLRNFRGPGTLRYVIR